MGQYLYVEIDVLDGPYKGRKLFDRLNLINANPQTVEIAQRTLSAICHATGRMQVQDSEELHLIPFVADVQVQPPKNGYGESNKIHYLPLRAAPARRHASPAARPAQARPARSQRPPAASPRRPERMIATCSNAGRPSRVTRTAAACDPRRPKPARRLIEIDDAHRRDPHPDRRRGPEALASRAPIDPDWFPRQDCAAALERERAGSRHMHTARAKGSAQGSHHRGGAARLRRRPGRWCSVAHRAHCAREDRR
jgi:hypothetical protein